MNKFFFTLVLYGLIWSVNARANNVAYDDVNYLRLKDGDFFYILPDSYKYFAEKIISTNRILMKLYDEEYGHILDADTEYIFASHLSQMGNGFATMVPYSQAVLYPGGIFQFDKFATTNWLATLVYHETTHLYQLSINNSGPGKFSQLLFGNNWINFFPLPIKIFPLVTIPLPILTFPNFFMPDFFLEGNATFNESRFGYGGRLYSGHYRALFYFLLNKGLLRPDRILNDHVEFPFGTEKYIGGAYFWAHLVYEYGTKRAAQFFKHFSTKYLNPTRFFNAFEEYFAKSFDDYILTSFSEHRVRANAQLRFSKSTLVATSKVYNPLNKNEKGIFFLTSENGKSKGELVVVKNRDEIFRKKSNLKNGKIFELREKFYSASVNLVDRRKMLPSLWGEDLKPFPTFENQFVMDIRGENVVYADPVRSNERPYIVYNKKDFGEVYSSVLIHPQRELVYFKQEGKKRTLMLGDKELHSYKGYYGKPADIMPTGGILFIGPTERGSGLYMHVMGETLRVGRSDVVVDARWLESKYFLVVEIGKNGYEYRIAHIEDAKFDEVYEYAFFFEKDSWEDKVPFERNEVKVQGEKYSEFKHLRYSNTTLFLNSLAQGRTSVVGTMNFVDPLNYNNISLFVDLDAETREKEYSFTYLNQKKLLNWGMLIESDISQSLSGSVNKNSYRGLLKYHLMRKNDWDLFLTGSAGLGTSENKTAFDTYLGADLFRRYYNVIGYDPFDYQSVYAEVDLDVDGLQLAGLASYYTNFEDDFYFGLEAFGQFSFRDFFETGNLASGRKRLYPTITRTLLKDQSNYYLSGMGGVKWLIETDMYNEYFPLGLRRYAIEGFSGLTKFDGSLSQYNLLWGAKVEFELIITKRFIQRLSFSVVNASTGEGEYFLGLSQGF